MSVDYDVHLKKPIVLSIVMLTVVMLSRGAEDVDGAKASRRQASMYSSTSCRMAPSSSDLSTETGSGAKN